MRNVSPTVAAALTSNYVRLAVFAQLEFLSSTEYVWNGRGPIAWNGQVWQGLGDLATISTITEDSTLTAQGTSIALSGIRADLIAEALTEVQQGRACRIWLVFADASGTPLDALLSYAGRMDQPTIEESVDTVSISISLENRLSDLQRAQYRRLTDQDQRLVYPLDDGFKFINQIQDWNGSWGSH